MKKKLTLTVEEDIVKYAKRLARRHGKSVSEMFEETFKEGQKNTIQTESQKAAGELLKKLEVSDSVKTRKDKELIKKHVKRKFT
jgi:23S rRNA pseudoU1915 N3-methylase RlmH